MIITGQRAAFHWKFGRGKSADAKSEVLRYGRVQRH